MTSLSKLMPHCQYFDPKGVNFMTPMSKKKQCGQDYDKDVMIAGFPLLLKAVTLKSDLLFQIYFQFTSKSKL